MYTGFMKSGLASENLTQTLAQSLTQVSIKAGCRLRSERDLAAKLSVDRMKVRRAISDLVDKGILVRRHGSGTYVRKVEKAYTGPEYSQNPEDLISADILLAEAEKLTTRHQPMATQKQLHFGLWTDVYWTTVSHQLMIAGLVERATQTGHMLTIHSIVEQKEVQLSDAKLKHNLDNNICDGYMVAGWCAEVFLKAVGQPVPPVIFFGGSQGFEYEPMIIQDYEKTIERAIGILAKEGFRKIAMIEFKSSGQFPEIENKSYDHAMAQAGLTYRAIEMSEFGVAQSILATERLLNRADPPDAIFVGDDYLMAGVAEALAGAKQVPGRDLGLITLSNRRGQQLPDGFNWSRMEFDAELFGRILFDNLLDLVQTAGTRSSSLSVHATWCPGQTHRRSPV
jgi:DNA-binding LacI/PurR family transcriptional regulator